MSKSDVATGDIELRSHGYQVLRMHWEIIGTDVEIDLKFRNNQSCSVPIVYKWHERFRNGRTSTEDDSRNGHLRVVKTTLKGITFWHF